MIPLHRLPPPAVLREHGEEWRQRYELAFAWENLYLACDDCQNKLENRLVPVTDCADPCAPFEPDDHFAFDDDMIRPVSSRGDAAVRKYRLNADVYAGRRARALNDFCRALELVLRRQIADGRRRMSPEERAALERFTAPDWPYSLMFRWYLRRADLAPGPVAPPGE